MSPTARFTAKVIPEPFSGCWIWHGAADQRGYGNFHYEGRQESAHRAAWIIFKGSIPVGQHVCHHCDTPACVNPSHLFLGSRGDNMRDCSKKGRLKLPLTLGHRNASAVLNEDAVVRLRKARNEGATYEQLAGDFGITPTTASLAVRGKTWTHVREVLEP